MKISVIACLFSKSMFAFNQSQTSFIAVHASVVMVPNKFSNIVLVEQCGLIFIVCGNSWKNPSKLHLLLLCIRLCKSLNFAQKKHVWQKIICSIMEFSIRCYSFGNWRKVLHVKWCKVILSTLVTSKHLNVSLSAVLHLATTSHLSY